MHRPNEFKYINDPASWLIMPVVPFEHSSGTSVRGRNKVSHKANKQLKSLLHMCATSALKAEGEFKVYFDRKIAEGKNKFIVINAYTRSSTRSMLASGRIACTRSSRKQWRNRNHLAIKTCSKISHSAVRAPYCLKRPEKKHEKYLSHHL
ncbi:MAG: transposase [Bacteroidetes bacterium]|nr:transposase [Bacteroidota bacterium]